MQPNRTLILITFLLLLMASISEANVFIKSQQASLKPPVLEKIWLQGKSISADSVAHLKHHLELPFEKNFITLQYYCPDLDYTENVSYAYKLDGHDSAWIAMEDQRKVSFANLGSGMYTFKFRSSTDGINWVDTSSPLKFQVTTPFWYYWWFPLISILLVGVVLYIIYKIRITEAINRVLAMEQMRKQETEELRVTMAQDFHDEMGNKLASIIVLGSTLDLLLKDKSKEVKKALDRIEEDSKSLFSGTKTFIWSIDPKSDSLFEIFNYIIHFGTDLYEHTIAEFVIKHHPEERLRRCIMPVGVSRQIFFIFKEAMTNSMVHSNAKTISFDFKVDSSFSFFEVSLADDGVGLTEEQLESSRGLNNMRIRAKKINCHLSFSNNPNQGLTVKLSGDIPRSKGL